MKKRKSKVSDELRPEYDLRELLKGAVRGKYGPQLLNKPMERLWSSSTTVAERVMCSL